MSADSIISVQVSILDQLPEEDNFGTPMLVAAHSLWPERTRSYDTLQGLLDDGFTANDPAYLWAAAIKSQSPGIKTLKIGRRALDYTKSFNVTPTDTTEGRIYTMTILHGAGSSSIPGYTVGAADTVADIIDGLKTQIDALSLALTTTDNTTDLDIDATTAGDWFAIAGLNNYTDLDDDTADPGIATDLAAILAEDEGFYFVSIDSEGAPEIEAASAWVETAEKQLWAISADADVRGSGSSDVISTLGALDYQRTFITHRRQGGTMLDGAWVSRKGSQDPGSTNWAHTALTGQAKDSFTTTERSNVLGKNGNLYLSCKGLGDTQFGTAVGGRFADITRGVDWIADQAQTRLFALLHASEKVPFTDGGVEGIASILEKLGDDAVDQGIIAEGSWVVSLPLVADVSAADKAARCLTGAAVTGTLAGAINKVELALTFSV